MKAFVKVNISIHVQDPDTKTLNEFGNGDAHDGEVVSEYKRRLTEAYPIPFQVAGVSNVRSREEAISLGTLLSSSLATTFAGLSISQKPEDMTFLSHPGQQKVRDDSEAAVAKQREELVKRDGKAPSYMNPHGTSLAPTHPINEPNVSHYDLEKVAEFNKLLQEGKLTEETVKEAFANIFVPGAKLVPDPRPTKPEAPPPPKKKNGNGVHGKALQEPVKKKLVSKRLRS